MDNAIKPSVKTQAIKYEALAPAQEIAELSADVGRFQLKHWAGGFIAEHELVKTPAPSAEFAKLKFSHICKTKVTSPLTHGVIHYDVYVSENNIVLGLSDGKTVFFISELAPSFFVRTQFFLLRQLPFYSWFAHLTVVLFSDLFFPFKFWLGDHYNKFRKLFFSFTRFKLISGKRTRPDPIQGKPEAVDLLNRFLKSLYIQKLNQRFFNGLIVFAFTYYIYLNFIR